MRGADASTESQVPSISAPTISLPKGGGAIRGMGEKFAANPVTGTGSMTVPIATSPGRSGFGPQLSLTYDSGAGNGPFGFGWSLALPAIVRKTDKGLPRYRDWSSDPADADVFVLSGAEDLVPVFRCDANGDVVTDANGQPQIHEDTIDGYRVRRYRPRIEGLFARIERWQWIPTTTDPRPEIEQRADVHWRSISRDNILTIYGADANSRIADPEDPARIFSWLICETRDDKGNGIRYLYKPEDGASTLRPGQGDPLLQAHQRNRGAADAPARTVQRYLQHILYGNCAPLLDDQGRRPRRLSDLPNPPGDSADDWLFEVRFDYGELDEADPTGQPEQAWFYRPDAFSSYRSGFEVRTCRRCERVLMLHHIPDQPASGDRPEQLGYEGVVRSTEFTYDDELDPTLASRPVYSFLKQVVQRGWKQENGTTITRSLPPLEFRYSQPRLGEQVEEVDLGSLENLPIGLDGSAFRWVDLHGEGLPGILSEQAGAWYYKRNLTPLSQRLRADSKADVATFAPLETVPSRPNVSLAAGAQMLDLAGDGLPDVVTFSGPAPGLYEHDETEGWQPFRPFRQLPNVDFGDPNLRFIDLDGDGHADLLVSEGEAFVWHHSLEEEGFEPVQRVPLPWDEEKGPRVVFADGTESFHLADMSGDGLADVVRIRAGLQGNEVCYWPNLGYGRFGAKVTMDNAPVFDHPELFDAKRLLLADIDGSGTTDLIYLHAEGVRLYFNQAGNSWSEAVQLQAFPPIHSAAQVTALDLLGNGTACLLWSSPLVGDGGRQMRYVPLMAEGKPHLLTTSINNLGAETRVQYCSSLRFYLEDKLAGKPWITRLPFPVHVVERVETIDHISRNRFISRYAYHHGYFDGKEREFRGFGMVEQWDTEEFATLAGGQIQATNIAAESHVPPAHTKTWFHTGVSLGRDHVSDYFAGMLDAYDTGEYYRPPGLNDEQARVLLLDDTVLPEGLSAEEEREACRALKGSMLRQEVYAEDGSAKAPHPYVITEQNFSVRQLQPAGTNRHGVFFTHPREAISCHSERNPDDPRISHALTLEVDDYGNVLKEAAIGYGRAEQVPMSQADGTPGLKPNPAKAELDDPDPAKSGLTQQDWYRQCLIHITYTENHLTNAVGEPADPGAPQPPPDAADTYRTPLPCRTSTYELRRAEQDRSAPKDWIRRFSFEEIADRIASAADGSHDIAYEDLDFRAAQEAVQAGEADAEQSWRRLIEEVRILYRPDDLGTSAQPPGSPGDDPTTLLPLGRLESLALPGEAYKLALTPGLISAVYQRRLAGAEGNEPLLPNPEAILPLPADPTTASPTNRGGYVDLDGDGRWWLPSGRIFYAPGGTDTAAAELAHARQHFFLPHRFRDPFHTPAWSTEQFVGYGIGDLLVTETRDPLGNQVTAVHDYRVLQPALITDPNGNRSEVAFDTLGLVVGTAVMGKGSPAPVEGDSLEGFEPDLGESDIAAHLASPLDNPTAILGQATTRLVYGLFAYLRTKNQPQPAPPVVYTLARETHVSDLGPNEQPRIQHAFSYSDGFGREIQKKAQAEPGPVPRRDATGQVLHDACGRVLMTAEDLAPRWVASGWTIFNNKGKPVRQYEPFFSPTHGFEFGVRAGVSLILFYDPLGRVVATLHPNHTWKKVIFDAWRQDSWDVSDTIGIDPRTDDDVKGFFVQPDGTARLAEQDFLPLWYDLRTDPALAARLSTCYPDATLRNAEIKAAHQAAAHANTPSTAHLDALGRPFLNIARNRVECTDHPLEQSEAAFATRVELDIEGNQHAVIDAKDRVVMRYAYDLLGNRIHQASMEAGSRWMLADVAGNPIRAWDSRGFNRRLAYDRLRRPTGLFVSSPAFHESHGQEEIQPMRTVYGETQPNPEQTNHRGKIYQVFEDAGVVTSLRYDFKGNLLAGRRELRQEYKKTADWQQQEPLEDERFDSRTWYDALSRLIQSIAPHSEHEGSHCNVTRHAFNEAGLLERIDVWNQLAAAPVGLLSPDTADLHAVTDIDYDAKGQRTRIAYGNGAVTTYSYDPLTFRLINLRTTRSPGQNGLANALFTNSSRIQDLRYTYDPAGNITQVANGELQTLHYANQKVDPISNYVYDSVNRLIQATGREHIGQSPFQLNPPDGNCRDYPFAGLGAQTSDPTALRGYAERYVYDEVGNFLRFLHQANGGTWQRDYAYEEPSLLAQPGAAAVYSNRLSGTTLHPNGAQPVVEPYAYDAHGNMTRMPHLPLMAWDFKDQLRASSRQVVNNGGTPEITYYVYDAAGQRVRKVTERQAAEGETPTQRKERVYLGGFEIYREFDGGGANRTKERESLHVMDDKQHIALVETATFGAESAGELGVPVIRYQLMNHLGSASLELDRDGGLISYEEYRPYGTTAFQAGKSLAEISLKRYRYTGKERDEETGFSYHGARYDAVWLARWVSCDPAFVAEDSNSYSYARNPVAQTDKNGTQPELTDDEFTASLSEPLYVGIAVETYEETSAKHQAARDRAEQKTRDSDQGHRKKKKTHTQPLDGNDMPKCIQGTGPQVGDREFYHKDLDTGSTHHYRVTEEQWELIEESIARGGSTESSLPTDILVYEAADNPDLEPRAQVAGRSALNDYYANKISTALTEQSSVYFTNTQTSSEVQGRTIPLAPEQLGPIESGTIAGTPSGVRTHSGFLARPGYASNTRAVWNQNVVMGYRMRGTPMDWGYRGAYYASHAEMQAGFSARTIGIIEGMAIVEPVTIAQPENKTGEMCFECIRRSDYMARQFYQIRTVITRTSVECFTPFGRVTQPRSR